MKNRPKLPDMLTPVPTLALAPMQDVTDLPFMRVMQRFGGPDVYVTEYFRVHAAYHLEKHILRSITESHTGRPVYAQMIGQDISALVRCAKELLRYPVAGVDLNLGCPAPVVCRKDAGGGLLRKKEHLHAMLGALREVIPGKFTVKTRVGYHSHEEFSELLELFQSHEIDTLTIHGRTVLERYRTPIHTDCIQQAVQQMDCPVIANGNVVDVETGTGLIERTGAAGLMIGRGAIRHPWIFDQLRAVWAGEPVREILRSDLLEYIMDLYQELAGYQQHSGQGAFDERKHVNRMKKYMVYIAQGLDPEFEYQIRRAFTEHDFHSICHSFLENDTPLPVRPPLDSKLFCGFDALRSGN
ncbi:tRNA dihydrouridine synthase [Oceaniferula flava]|nr:tRNA-dihydrouridine synthase family protein [Oceaniferula flavus]